MKKIQLTKSELIETFHQWNIDFSNNQDGFEEIKFDLEFAERQANHFIEILNSIKNNDSTTQTTN